MKNKDFQSHGNHRFPGPENSKNERRVFSALNTYATRRHRTVFK